MAHQSASVSHDLVKSTNLLNVMPRIPKVLDDGRISSSAMEREQRATHGLAWLATYVESLRQLDAYASRLSEQSRYGELEDLIVRLGFAEYLAQIFGGIPMNQGEIVRLTDLGLTMEDIADVRTAEIDQLVFGATDKADAKEQEEEPVELPGDEPVVSQLGDLWVVGMHRLLCGDALVPESYEHLLGGEKAQMVFTDPPYNVPISGHVSGLGKKTHREFAMASGEQSSPEFTALLRKAMMRMAEVSVNGAIHFICMDWRHAREMDEAGRAVYSELKNICVWAKTNAGMGTFYRSQHEFVFAWKVGTAKHINNFGLGEKGRYRTNVWTYAGANTFRKGRDEDLADHPTVKPVQMVEDAILDLLNNAKGPWLLSAMINARIIPAIHSIILCD